MTTETYYVSLTEEELLLLDGQCTGPIQVKVNIAKQRRASVAALPEAEESIARFVADVVRLAETTGKLSFGWISVTTCPVCRRNDGYWPYPRHGRYHRKGEPNRATPKTFRAVELHTTFITIKNHVNTGCCQACWEKAKPVLLPLLANVRAALPEAITGEAPQWKRYEKRRCTKCGWEGHEGEMGWAPALMGNGRYPSRCPKCGAQNQLFNLPVDIIPGFVVVPASFKEVRV